MHSNESINIKPLFDNAKQLALGWNSDNVLNGGLYFLGSPLHVAVALVAVLKLDAELADAGFWQDVGNPLDAERCGLLLVSCCVACSNREGCK